MLWDGVKEVLGGVLVAKKERRSDCASLLLCAVGVVLWL
jgi:hypothetical protein